MKLNLATIAICALPLIASCGKKTQQHAEVATVTPAEQLASRLTKISTEGKVAFGHHDDTAYGHSWKYETDRSDVRDVCGDYPALMHWDLGLLEWNCDRELDGVPFELIRNEVAKQDARGGINAFSWHPRNPVTKGDSWNCEGDSVVAEYLVKGSELNDTLRVWIGRTADFIGSLRNAEGQRIGVVFRPWHEHTGSWFWWGYDHCSREDYIALWKLTREIFDEKGIDNVLWAYSPDKDHVTGVETYLDRYPGDEYVDIMGGDVYHFDGEQGLETFRERVHNVIGSAVEAAKAHGKLAAFSETGSEGLPMENWWTEVLLPILRDYKVCLVTVWRNAHDKPQHFYAPFPGEASEESFKAFYADSITLFARDINKVQ